jgi:hypothetical protein
MGSICEDDFQRGIIYNFSPTSLDKWHGKDVFGMNMEHGTQFGVGKNSTKVFIWLIAFFGHNHKKICPRIQILI